MPCKRFEAPINSSPESGTELCNSRCGHGRYAFTSPPPLPERCPNPSTAYVASTNNTCRPTRNCGTGLVQPLLRTTQRLLATRTYLGCWLATGQQRLASTSKQQAAARGWKRGSPHTTQPAH